MKDAPLLCLGTPLGHWHGLARAIQSGHGSTDQARFEAWIRSTLGVPAASSEPSSEEDACRQILSSAPVHSNASAPELSSESGVLFSSLGCWLVDLLLERLPHVRILAFYEPPAHMLARRLDVEAPADPAQILAVWEAATAKILAALRRHRNRVYLLSAEECTNAPSAFAHWLQKTLGTPVNAGAQHGASPVDPLLLGLAETLCSSSLKLLPLVQECEASRYPLLSGDQPILAEPVSEIAREALAAALLLKRNWIQSQAELADTRQKAAQDHEKALGIHEMLLLEIHNAHKESEDFFERWKKAETLHGQLSLTAGALLRGRIHDDSDHRHFEFTLKDAELFGRQWPRLDFRLLAHHGNAGIALFLPPNSPPPPLYAWEPAGTEKGVPYVLLVPSDAKAKRALVAATTHDLLLLKDAVALLAADLRLQGAPTPSKTDWSLTASRLLVELDDLPERLHYDSVHTRTDRPAPGSVTLHFNVIRAFFRGTLYPSFDFAWTPAASGGGVLTFSRTPDNPPPLHHWPLAPDGSPAAEWRLDFGNATSPKAKRKLWACFSSSEKALLRVLISEIPNFVFHLLRQHPKETLDKESLNRHARSMLAELKEFGRRRSAMSRLRMVLSK